MLYRAQDRNGTSRLGYADSADGINFERRPDPVFSPEADHEKDGGVEDPRFVNIGGSGKGGHYFLYYGGADKYIGVAQAWFK
jgi:beta-1,2-mannosidase